MAVGPGQLSLWLPFKACLKRTLYKTEAQQKPILADGSGSAFLLFCVRSPPPAVLNSPEQGCGKEPVLSIQRSPRKGLTQTRTGHEKRALCVDTFKGTPPPNTKEKRHRWRWFSQNLSVGGPNCYLNLPVPFACPPIPHCPAVCVCLCVCVCVCVWFTSPGCILGPDATQGPPHVHYIKTNIWLQLEPCGIGGQEEVFSEGVPPNHQS